MAVGLLSVAVLSGCRSSSPSVGQEEGEGADVTTVTSANNPTGPGQALVLSERETAGLATQELVTDTDDLLSTGERITLSVGEPSEDRSEREVLVLTFPAEEAGGPEGHYVLSVAPADSDPVEIRAATWSTTESGLSVDLEATAGTAVEGRWSFSLRPRFRQVFLADDDFGIEIEASVFHVADLGPGPVEPAASPLDAEWSRLRFEVPAWLIDQAPLAQACERLLDRLDEDVGSGNLDVAEADANVGVLNRAAENVERDVLQPGLQVNVTLEFNGQEMVRGRRLQPLVRYPITILRSDGTPLAATLGCSISDG